MSYHVGLPRVDEDGKKEWPGYVNGILVGFWSNVISAHQALWNITYAVERGMITLDQAIARRTPWHNNVRSGDTEDAMTSYEEVASAEAAALAKAMDENPDLAELIAQEYASYERALGLDQETEDDDD